MSDEITQAPLFDPETYETIVGAEVVNLSDVTERLDLEPVMVKAEDLIDETFIIRGASSFPSAYENQDHAWYCICESPKDQERFAVVLGGMAVVKILDVMAAAGFDHPLQVTLRQKAGGKYGRYYVIE